jgi:hypothetical protein
VISKPKEAFYDEDYLRLGLPAAPAVMIGKEVIVQGSDIPEDQLDAAIRRHLAQDGEKGKKDCGFLSGG